MSAILDSVRGIDLHDQGSRKRLSKMGGGLFEHWQIFAPHPGSPPRPVPPFRGTVGRYRRGDPLADNTDLLARAGHLLAIHKALRIMFPHDRDLAYRWVGTPNRRFGDRTPLETLRQGYEGILAVRRYLDFERGR